ncbi:hypothetical protein BJX64DRAFT_17754 [Aspergillus heterothallicus]
MALHKLPPELVYTILRFVGSHELRKHNARYLLVCKWWYALAEPILYEDLAITANDLLYAPKSAQAKLASHASRLTLYANGPKEWVNDSERLNEHLNVLLSQAPCLRTFALRAALHFDLTQPLSPSQHYVSNWSPAPLLDGLSISRILNLEIDTHGSNFSDDIHICPEFARLIPSLRSLRLRMRKICPEALQLRHQDIGRPVRLQSLIINLSLLEPGSLSSGSSRHCQRFISTQGLFDQMIVASTRIAREVPSLVTVRVLGQKYSSLDTLVHNCLTGRKMILPQEGQWDWSDDGRLDREDGQISNREPSTTGSDTEANIGNKTRLTSG